MNADKISKTISDYEDLVELTYSKIKVIGKYSSEFNTLRGIENVEYYKDKVNVTCDDTCMGCYDTHSFDFPLEWLSKSDEELETIVTTHKELKEEKERAKKEEEERKKKEEKEYKEKADYERLKKKFESVN